MESTRGVMHQCWHTYGRSGIMKWTNWSYLSWEPHLYVFLVSVQYTLATECFQLGYNAEGHCKGEVDASLAEPQKLNWEISSEVCFHSLLYVNNQKVHHQEYHTSGITVTFCRSLNKSNFYSHWPKHLSSIFPCFRENRPAQFYRTFTVVFSPQCEEQISQSLEVAQALANDVDMHVVVFRDFGKAKVKKCRVNPDAFIQIALQLAYYRVISPGAEQTGTFYRLCLRVQKGILL